MKKLVSTLLATAMLVGLGAAFAQASSHDVEIRIPNVLQLRIVNGAGVAAASGPSVTFDFQGDADAYLDTVNGGGGELAPTSWNQFDNVVVFSNRATWSVTVSATAIVFDNNYGLAGMTPNGVSLADIIVRPSGTTETNVSSRASSWDMTGGTIASGVRTQGWRRLGFGGGDYRFAVNGDENPGTYTTTVTYTIAAP